MAFELPPATVRFLRAAPEPIEDVRHFPEGTKTAEDAASAIGCPVAAIVKSLVFIVSRDGVETPVLALVAGDRRLDTAKLAALCDADGARRASLDEVKAASGYAPGGTPPFGHPDPLQVFADLSLRRNDPVWAAAGTPTTVFPITLATLDRLASPVWTDLVEE